MFERKNCLACGERFAGRADKKFCSDACRNAFNNKNNADQVNLMRNVHNRLRKNYRILCAINGGSRTKTTREYLAKQGFEFNLVTNIHRTSKGNTYYFLYDQGYMPLDNEKYILVRKAP